MANTFTASSGDLETPAEDDLDLDLDLDLDVNVDTCIAGKIIVNSTNYVCQQPSQ